MALEKSTRFLAVTFLLFATRAFPGDTPPSGAPSSGAAVAPQVRCPLATLRRTTCFGTCPDYDLTIYKDGRVEYLGWNWVKACGPRTAALTPTAVAALEAAFAQAGYFALDDAYDRHDVTDNPSAYTTYCDGTRTKSVKHYYGDRSAPHTLTHLEARIDAIARTERWIGNRDVDKMLLTGRGPCPQIECRVGVPLKFRDLPNGEPRSVRYRTAYEAFWWNCVLLLAKNPKARCPMVCSGKAGAAAGCARGSSDAWNQTRNFIKTYGEERARHVLRSLAASPEGKFKIGPYFGGHPSEESLPRRE